MPINALIFKEKEMFSLKTCEILKESQGNPKLILYLFQIEDFRAIPKANVKAQFEVSQM